MNHSHAPAIIDELYTSLCSLFYPGVNSRAELVTLAPGLRPERGFAPLARGLFLFRINSTTIIEIYLFELSNQPTKIVIFLQNLNKITFI